MKNFEAERQNKLEVISISSFQCDLRCLQKCQTSSKSPHFVKGRTCTSKELEIESAAEGWGWSDVQIRPRPDRQNLLLKGTQDYKRCLADWTLCASLSTCWPICIYCSARYWNWCATTANQDYLPHPATSTSTKCCGCALLVKYLWQPP